jgi:hypothetical protein
MSEPITVDFRAVKRPGNGVDLLCKRTTDQAWPPDGHQYANWKQLLGTMSGILEVPEGDLDILRTDVLPSQLVTAEQLHRLRLPNFNMVSAFPSYQNIDPGDDDPDED